MADERVTSVRLPAPTTITRQRWERSCPEYRQGDPGSGTAKMLMMTPRGTCLVPVHVEGSPAQWCGECGIGPFFLVPGRTHPRLCFDCAAAK